MSYLKIGKIIDSHGLDGTFKVFNTTDSPKKRYAKGNKVYLYNESTDERLELTVERFRLSGQIAFVKLEGIDNPESAKEFKGFEIHTIKDRNDLEVGYYFYEDLVGCAIMDQNKNELGKVSKVEEFPAQITLRVKRSNGKDFFVPFVKQFIKKVDIDAKKIHIEVIEGML
jgi:16S rRNA processing protein RimM